jgi:hypothetical protein
MYVKFIYVRFGNRWKSQPLAYLTASVNNCIITDNVCILFISCNVKNSEMTTFTEKSRKKYHSNWFGGAYSLTPRPLPQEVNDVTTSV